jgi:hypothetical protein
MKTSHLIRTINHTATLPFYNQKYTWIEQVMLKYFYFAWLMDLRPLVKGSVSHHDTNTTLAKVCSGVYFSDCHLLKYILNLWKLKWVAKLSGRSTYALWFKCKCIFSIGRLIKKSAGGDDTKAGRCSIQIDTIHDRGITDVYSRILRHVADSIQNIWYV